MLNLVGLNGNWAISLSKIVPGFIPANASQIALAVKRMMVSLARLLEIALSQNHRD